MSDISLLLIHASKVTILAFAFADGFLLEAVNCIAFVSLLVCGVQENFLMLCRLLLQP